jgi:1-acyl-sn-glycerol-3-phosphate acyltransferase
VPYTAYAVAVFTVISLLLVLAVLLLPGMAMRRQVAHQASRLFLWLAGYRLRLLHAENLPEGPCIVVANHASYIDGPVMKAALPPRFGFVIKREMDGVPLAGLMLRRIGSQFVERKQTRAGARDALRVLRAAAQGASLGFFPEGTFAPEPGLLRFHSGAFVTAVKAGCPVVPCVIRGTRRALPPDGSWPRPGLIEVELTPPLTSSADDPVTDLRQRARRAILARLDEPDLHPED